MANQPRTARIDAPEKGKKYFTVDEANRASVYISKVVNDIVDSYKRAMELRGHLAQSGNLTRQLKSKHEKELDQETDRLTRFCEELDHAGVELRNYKTGDVDFPAIYQGREIRLLWNRGEQRVNAWHEAGTGYAGSQVGIEELMKDPSHIEAARKSMQDRTLQRR